MNPTTIQDLISEHLNHNDNAAIHSGSLVKTYNDLNEDVNNIANSLMVKKLKKDTGIAVFLEDKVAFIASILGILKAGYCFLPIDINYPIKLVNKIISKANIKYLITDPMNYSKLEKFYSPNNIPCNVFQFNELFILDEQIQNRTPGVKHTPDDIIYHYPVFKTHENIDVIKGKNKSLTHIINWAAKTFDIFPSQKFSHLASTGTDAFLLDIFLPLCNGGTIHIPENKTQKDPQLLIQWLEEMEINVMIGTPTLFRNILNNYPANNEPLSALNNLIILSADIFPEELTLWYQKIHHDIQLFTLYGYPEITIAKACYQIKQENCNSERIPIGKPIAGSRFIVLNEKLKVCDMNSVGEIYIRTPYRCLNSNKFIENPFNNDPDDLIFRTGDSGRLLADGNIEIIGRNDRQINIDGHQTDLLELENIILTHEKIKKVVVLTKYNQQNYTGIYVFFVSDYNDLTAELHDFLADELPPSLLPSYYIPVDSIPYIENGSIDTKKLFDKVSQKDKDQFQAPISEIERKLIEIWAKELEIDKNDINTDTNYFDIGGNSIKAIQIIPELKKVFGVDISLIDFIEKSTLKNVASLIIETKNSDKKIDYPKVAPDLENLHEPFPLTAIQLSYLLGRENYFEMGGISTHSYIEIKSKMDISRFNEAFNKVIARQPMMRTIVYENGSQQILEGDLKYDIDMEDISHLSEKEQQGRIQVERNRMSHHIFKTDQWPLFEVKAFKLDHQTIYLCFGIDTIIACGSSKLIIFKDLMHYYNNPAEKLKPLDFSFRDYMIAYHQLRNSDLYQQAKMYWMNKLKDFPLSPALPLKCNPLDIATPHFSQLRKVFPTQEWEAIKNAAKENNITPTVLLFMAFAKVLSYWCNQSRFALNLTVYNRYPFHENVNKMVGDFTSLILLDITIHDQLDFWENAKIFQNTLFEGLENRYYDGVEFIRELANRYGFTNQAVMPVVFTSALYGADLDTSDDIGESGSLSGKWEYINNQTSQVYLDNIISEEDGCLVIMWNYVEELYEEDIIKSMFENSCNIVSNLIEDKPDRLHFISNDDLNIIDNYNKTAANIPPATLCQLFYHQFAQKENHIAIEDNEIKITYKELDRRSNQIAQYLRARGVTGNTLIGVSAARTAFAIINILGILKSGAAYVPIDPTYPHERRMYILNDCNYKLFLDDTLCMNQMKDSNNNEKLENIINNYNDIAYVLYTSGSTGRPKGVAITHRAVCNTLIDVNNKFEVNNSDRIIGVSSLGFDLSVYDVFGIFHAGGTLVLIKDQRDIPVVFSALKRYNITIWNSVPVIMDKITQFMERQDFSGSGSIYRSGVGTDETLYHWSPNVHWKKLGDKLLINQKKYANFTKDIFPKFYFFTQEGTTLEKIFAEFPQVERGDMEKLITDFINDRILVQSILSPDEVFLPQMKLFKHLYSDEILYDETAYNKYKYQQVTRNSSHDIIEKIKIGECKEFPGFMQQRRTYRTFNKTRKIPGKVFSKVLNVFNQREDNGEIRYYYASAGGLYPIDIYIYIKQDRIDEFDQGLYYYCPFEHSLNLVNKGKCITRDIHHISNQTIFDESAFTVFMIYNADSSMPKYGSKGYLFACIDTGIIVGALSQITELMGMGVCSIGTIHSEKISPYFGLKENQVLIHTVECGIKDDIDPRVWDEIVHHTEKNVSAIQRQVETEKADPPKQSLRLVMLSGDLIPLHLPEKIKESFHDVEVFSLGGPTEASIWQIYYPLKQMDPDWRNIPYGMPLANHRIYIKNYLNENSPIGIEGELYVAGSGLAEGYLNKVEQTHRLFIQDGNLGRLYKTGDFGILHKTGYIEFRGRKDSQVKVRGHRIELAEIEKQLHKIKGIQKAIVTVIDNSKNDKSLCAYYISDRELSINELRNDLLKSLPYYMTPSYFLRINTVPLSPNGKIDKKALPLPEKQVSTGVAHVSPNKNIEKNVAEIWEGILNIENPGIDDNFFDLGGTSLDIAELSRKLTDALGFAIRVITLFEYPTIRSFIQYLENMQYLEIENMDIKEENSNNDMVNGDYNDIENNNDNITTEQNRDILLKRKRVLENIG